MLWFFVISVIIACKLNFIDNTNEKEPYVYVQTYNEYKKFTEPLFRLVKQDPSKYQAVGHIILDDQWPLAWVLNDFTKVGYYGKNISPPRYDADFLAVEGSRVLEIEEKLQEKYFKGSFRLHSAQGPSNFYLNYETFKDIFPKRVPEFTPKPKEPLLPGQGILALFYSNKEWEGTSVIKKRVGQIDLQWEDYNRPLPAPFSIEFKGEIYLPELNSKFVLYTDDGGFVEIGGTRIIDDPGPHALQGKEGTVTSGPGWRKIRVGFYDIGGGVIIRLVTKNSNGVENVVSASSLRFNEELLNQ